MKKFTSIFVLTFVLFGFSANYASAGGECAPGDLYSSITGRLCPPSVMPSFTGELAIGSRGDDVRSLQQILKGEGYYSGRIDGNFGKRTARAVKDFQDDNDLPITGRVDYQTAVQLGLTFRLPPPPILPTPTISGVSGPQSLSVNETGTWMVNAYDQSGGNLWYSVVWGDEGYLKYGYIQGAPTSTQQSATFTHSYSQAGTYSPTFTVQNKNGQSAKTSLSVKVGSTNSNPITVTSPNGGETWTKGTTQTIKWRDDTSSSCPVGMFCVLVVPTYDIKLVEYFSPCGIGLGCPQYFRGPLSYTIANNVSGSSYSWSVGKTDSAVVPDGSYTIQICKPGGLTCDSSDSYFKITEGKTPTISSLSPTSGPAGTSVFIYGSNLSTPGDTVSVNFGNYYLDVDNGCRGTQLITCFTVPTWVSPGDYKVSLNNAYGTSNNLSFTVKRFIEILGNGPLPSGAKDKPYTSDILLNGVGQGFTSSISSGNLPPGLSLTPGADFASVRLSGTPTSAGIYYFTLTITYNGQSASQSSSITIDPSPFGPTYISFVTTSLPAAYVNQPYNARILFSSDGRWSPNIIVDGLPNGISVRNSSPGWPNAIYGDAPKDANGYYYLDLGGTPAQSGNFNISFYAFNTNHTFDFTKNYTLVVYPATCSSSGYDTMTGFRCGCSSTSGYSSYDGQSCSVSSGGGGGSTLSGGSGGYYGN